ncbi:MAG: PD-(D/E)XK nuclease family protein [Holosporaceae bacterium]|jgi:ATP-dependent helicase/nuclease subunit B|nr:PD-(D/E)XK nuclease family protein [Holosporaceae bacterium]
MPCTIYNIPLSKNFLQEAAGITAHVLCDTGGCRIFLPNRRSCRVFRDYFKTEIAEKTSPLPQISAISDELEFDDAHVAHFVTYLLRENIKNEYIPINNLFELAKGIASLLKNLAMSDLKWDQLENMVPKHLQKHWEHTFGVLSACMHSESIKKTIDDFKIKANLFLESLDVGRIASVGIGNTNRYAQLFLKKVAQSDGGLLFITGDERKESRNYQLNRQLLEILSLKTMAIDASSDGSSIASHVVEFAEFSSPASEAFGVSFAVKNALDEGKSVLIVCAELKLSEKIKMELRRWSIVPDDSIGVSFSKTADGLATVLIADMLESDFKLSNTMNALKVNGQYADVLAPFELFCRKLRFLPQRFFDAAFMYGEEKLPFLGEISKVYAMKFDHGSLEKWLSYCIEFLRIISPESVDRLDEIARSFLKSSHLLGNMYVSEFVIFLKNQILTTKIRSSTGYTDGVVLVGIIETQLLSADFVIIAGTTEDNFAASNKNDFWMSKSMLKDLGIQTDDTKNMFVQSVFERLVHKRQVLVTRSLLVSGSRAQRYSYLDKIEALLPTTTATHLQKCVAEAWNTVASEEQKFLAPAPKIDDRPCKFSASDITQLANNPYGFYARKILRLQELNYMNGARNLKGNYVHETMEALVKKTKSKRDANEIYHIAEEILKKRQLNASSLGSWFFRLKNILAFVARHIDEADVSFAELMGACQVVADDGHRFELFCRADRIDVHPDKSISIVDYKTTTTTTQKQVKQGRAPQLLVETIIAKNDGFVLGTTDVTNLCIWQLTGSPDSTKIIDICNSREETNTLAEKALVCITKLIEQYNLRGVPYDININYEYDKAYHHLARVKEWSYN